MGTGPAKLTHIDHVRDEQAGPRDARGLDHFVDTDCDGDVWQTAKTILETSIDLPFQPRHILSQKGVAMRRVDDGVGISPVEKPA